MNRHQRRAARIKDPKGNSLDSYLLQILERDAQGRPTLTRLCHDDEVLGDVLGEDGVANARDGLRPEFLLIWCPPIQAKVPS